MEQEPSASFVASEIQAPLSDMKGSGDLVPLVVQCIANRGGRLPSSTPPSIQAEWTHQSWPMFDMIVIPGDQFSEVQTFLRQAYGEPDPKLASLPARAVGRGQSVAYSAQRIGIVLILTGNSKQTVVSLMGVQKP